MKYMTVGNELYGASQLILGCMRLVSMILKRRFRSGASISGITFDHQMSMLAASLAKFAAGSSLG